MRTDRAWIRRDLRLADNSALSLAAAQGPAVVPVFVLDPDVLHSTYHRAADKRKPFSLAAYARSMATCASAAAA